MTVLLAERAIIRDHTTCVVRALSDGYCACAPHTLLIIIAYYSSLHSLPIIPKIILE